MSDMYDLTGVGAYNPPEVIDPEDPLPGRGAGGRRVYGDDGEIIPITDSSGSEGSWLQNIWNDLTGVTAANLATQAATTAADTESAATQLAIDEQRRQFDAMQEILRPWVSQGTQALTELGQYETAGSDALSRQRALMGLDGPDAQRAAIEGLSSGAEMTGLIGQGEDALLQQGAATGGLRGGNVQGTLAQFRPQMLSSLINQQYSKLGGLINMGQGIAMNRATLGQASASGMAAGGMQNASSLGDLFMRQGSAIAGGQLAAGQGAANASNLSMQPFRDAGQMAFALGLKGLGVF